MDVGSWAGIVGPIGFVAVFLIEGAVRPGYDPVRHFVSLLSLTDRGWIQVANFVVGGLLIACFGLALRSAWAVGRARWVPRLVTLTGLALIWSGLFSGDPALGYPPGTPPGLPTGATVTGTLHYVGSTVVFGALASAILLASRSGPHREVRLWSAYSVASGALLLCGWIAGFILVGPSGVVETAGLTQRIAILAGWLWLVPLAVLHRRSMGANAELAGAPER